MPFAGLLPSMKTLGTSVPQILGMPHANFDGSYQDSQSNWPRLSDVAAPVWLEKLSPRRRFVINADFMMFIDRSGWTLGEMLIEFTEY